ncbi:MAG: 2-oxoacid:acceptor oxidoreductase subunit alpha [Deltaproteobacteria bacterium]|nr:2-oxoacid:acceptor oxidoreductase subunit alpha [Deltaproteobacteria bacterium]
MAKVDLTIEICGMSGDGTIAAGGMLNQAMSLAGFSVLAFDSYPAEIRGFGRCVTRSRFSDRSLLALEDVADVLISLDDEQSLSRMPFLSPAGVVFFDNQPPTHLPEDKSLAAHVTPDMKLLGVPFQDLATAAAGSSRGKNLAALGALAAWYGLDPDLFHRVIEGKFSAKGEKVLAANQKSFDAGYEYLNRELAERKPHPLDAPPQTEGPEKILLSGNQAVGDAALAAGLKNYFGYPITPATPIMEYLAKKLPKKGGRVVQMEDEISAIGAVLGSFFGGARAMTATSGPGFALMTELITHGVMSETPAVIVDAQRGGPATGLPTKTEQSDLLAAVYGGPGDSSRIVLAPTSVAECFDLVAKSFRLAEKFQTPVVVLSDFYLNNRVENLAPPKVAAEDLADGTVRPGPEDQKGYLRYRLTESGISPRALPGMEGFEYAATGLEHSERGNPEYAPDNHMAMSQKRRRKLLGALSELPAPEVHGPDGPLALGVMSWGSTWGSVWEAVEMAREMGLAVGALKVVSLYPFHAEVIRSFLHRADQVLIPELNLEGQLAVLLGHLQRKEASRLNLVTGVPISPTVILNKIKEILGVDEK